MKRWNQRVTDEKCPECEKRNVQKDKHENDVLVCRSCGLKYKKITCGICGSTATLNIHTKKETCNSCEVDVDA